MFRASSLRPVAIGFVAAILAAQAGLRAQQPTGSTAFERGWQNGTPATISGELTAVYADDFARGRAELMHFVRDARTGRTFTVHYQGSAPALRHGQFVTLSGRTSLSDLYVLAASTESVTSSTASESTADAAVAGDQRTLVIAANFSDKTLSCSVSDIEAVMFNRTDGRTVDALYREMSHGLVSLTGSVVGAATLNASSSDPCDITAWADEADRYAVARGIDLESFPRRVYVMPPNSCPAAGMAHVGAPKTRAWIFTCDMADVYAHELGHNFGMQHASTPADEYGDTSDVMGMSVERLRGINAPHARQMGWLPVGQAPEITDSGSHDIAPLQLDPSVAVAPQVLRVPVPDSNDYYYLSYRRPIGFDADLCCGYVERVNVHRGAAVASRTYYLGSLGDGESLTDPATGFSVRQTRHDNYTASVFVQQGQSCGQRAPSLIPDVLDATAAAGGTVAYTVTVVNNDASACSPTTFDLSVTSPSGWTSRFSTTRLSLTPGAYANVILTVTSLSSAAPGRHDLLLRAQDTAVTRHYGEATASYTVASLCGKTPDAAVLPSSQAAAAGVTLMYSVRVGNPDAATCAPSTFVLQSTAPEGWSAVFSTTTVPLAPGAFSTIPLAVTSGSSSLQGSYGFQVQARDQSLPSRVGAATGMYDVQSDTIAPTAPGNLSATLKRRAVNLSWQASSDNVGVAGYQVARNGSVIGATTNTTWIDQSVASGTDYVYSIKAFDFAGNVSAPSGEVTVGGGSSGGNRGKK